MTRTFERHSTLNNNFGDVKGSQCRLLTTRQQTHYALTHLFWQQPGARCFMTSSHPSPARGMSLLYVPSLSPPEILTSVYRGTSSSSQEIPRNGGEHSARTLGAQPIQRLLVLRLTW